MICKASAIDTECFSKMVNVPTPLAQGLTLNHLQLAKSFPPTLYKQFKMMIFMCLLKLSFLGCSEKESKRKGDKSCLVYSQFCCSFPQNVRLREPCFVFGFEICFSYSFLFEFIWGLLIFLKSIQRDIAHLSFKTKSFKTKK